ncbi:MAG: hypothetical protein J0J01_04110 [Reyranella sp.]|uniref:hypothetical protein n=1 Tax=Reyranella sp. TaxID=1929291 RepID=UPI001ACB6AC4|nr:hypothetical protein [Reyranella sp.]MBN9086072.1 hypothetical protein [Reyranella sp.]
MQSKTIKSLESSDGKRRAVIVERPDGTFQMIEEYWRRNEFDGRLIYEGWLPLSRHASFFETVEIAEREASARFHWLRD